MQRVRKGMPVVLDSGQRYGTDAECEAQADALLEASGYDTAHRASERDADGRDVIPLGMLDAVEEWTPDVPPRDALAALMSAPPLDLPRHRVSHRFHWAVGEGGYAPPRYSRDGVRRYVTLGSVKMMRLALWRDAMLADADYVSGLTLGLYPLQQRTATRLSRIVSRWMGALPADVSVTPGRAATGHHVGAVKGRRRTAAELAAIDITTPARTPGVVDGIAFDAARAERLFAALAVGGQTWADRVG